MNIEDLKQAKFDIMSSMIALDEKIKAKEDLNRKLTFGALILSFFAILLSVSYAILDDLSNVAKCIAFLSSLSSFIISIYFLVYGKSTTELHVASLKNTALYSEAKNFISKHESGIDTSREIISAFSKDYDNQSTIDEKLLCLKENERQIIYRKTVLRESNPSVGYNCDECGCDLSQFSMGNCKICGGKPATKKGR